MTIKEMETLSGMTRANIRYYEAEGFLSPERQENGYRDYSQEDLETLKRIKLLRLLGVSLADIKAAQQGAISLEEVMRQRLAAIAQERTALNQAESVCRELRERRESFAGLNAQRYLDELARAPGGSPKLPAQDVQPKVTSPWRRYFARMLDFSLCSCVWNCVMALVFHQNLTLRSTGGSLLDTAATLLLLLFVEPLLLHRFGTTLGKWILGLSVVHRHGRKLTYGEGLYRTWLVLWRGVGIGIPIYSLYRLWKSYRACRDGKFLDWEEESDLLLREGRMPVRAALYLAVEAVCIFTVVLSIAEAQRPPHRGDLTVAEFCENYNYIYQYYNPYLAAPLNLDGTWVQSQDTFWLGNTLPDFQFTEEDGKVTGITLRYAQGKEDPTSDAAFLSFFSAPQRNCALLAFTRAQPGDPLLHSDANALVDQIVGAPLQDFSVTVNGVAVENTFFFTGYYCSDYSVLAPITGETQDFTLTFSMKLTDTE